MNLQVSKQKEGLAEGRNIKVMTSLKKIVEHVVLALIRFYKVGISPYFSPSCRHDPTCSQYMMDAIQEWGLGKGLILGMKRLSRCHPWGTYGYDPVPKKKKQ